MSSLVEDSEPLVRRAEANRVAAVAAATAVVTVEMVAVASRAVTEMAATVAEATTGVNGFSIFLPSREGPVVNQSTGPFFSGHGPLVPAWRTNGELAQADGVGGSANVSQAPTHRMAAATTQGPPSSNRGNQC